MDDNRIFPKIPLDEWVELFRDFLKDNIQPFFDTIRDVIEEIDEALRWVLSIGDIPYSPFILMIIITIIGFFVSGWKMGLFSLVGLWLINNLGYWDHLLDTLSLVVISVLIAIIIGVPIGIWMSQKDLAQTIITPVLDFMQTMPAFVYLIPAVVFFKLGVVPGVVSTVIFSMPPTVRLTNLGIRQVDAELVEAADAFGSTTWQKLMKVQIPISMPTTLQGINQTIMLSLSMVVIASLAGAPGLGSDVYKAVSQVKIGLGFEAGLALVIIAMILDRFTQGKKKKSR